MRRETNRQPTEALLRLRAQQLQIERDIQREVWDLRARMFPVSWSAIGEALGVSKQAAQQRFRGIEDLEMDDLYDEVLVN